MRGLICANWKHVHCQFQRIVYADSVLTLVRASKLNIAALHESETQCTTTNKHEKLMSAPRELAGSYTSVKNKGHH